MREEALHLPVLAEVEEGLEGAEGKVEGGDNEDDDEKRVEAAKKHEQVVSS